jgi:PAS domain S-box-containing protein
LKTLYAGRIFRYGMVPVLLGLAVLLSKLTHPLIPHGEEYIFLAAVVGSAWIGRRGPGLFAALLALFMFKYFFLPPLYTLGISPEARPYLIPFGLSALAAAWMSSTRDKAMEATEGLGQGEAKFRRILTNHPDVAWTMDQSGRIIYLSPKSEKLLGYSSPEVKAGGMKLLLDRTDPEDLDLIQRAIGDLFSKGKPFDAEFRFQSKNGSWIWLHTRSTGTYPRDGVLCADGTTTDISRRKRAEIELRQAQKLEGIGQLAAGIAHEINTPTQFVTDNLTFLQESWATTFKLIEAYRAVIRKYLGNVQPAVAAEIVDAEEKGDLDFILDEVPRAIAQSLDGARRVASIVRAMKEFSHPDSAEKTETDLNKGIASTVLVARNEWKYVANVITNLDDNLPRLVCYPGEVNQVILNLLINAAHSIKEKVKDGEKGTITICTRCRGELAELAITDTGMGIPEEIQTRIYEPFFTTKEVGKGTGQGLALAHSVIVKKHQGKLWFETEIGRGTTFFIQLPIVQTCVQEDR